MIGSRKVIWYVKKPITGRGFYRLASELFKAFNREWALSSFTVDYSKPTARIKTPNGEESELIVKNFDNSEFVSLIDCDDYKDLGEPNLLFMYSSRGSYARIQFAVHDRVSKALTDEIFYECIFKAASVVSFLSFGFNYYREEAANTGGVSSTKYFEGFTSLPPGEVVPEKLRKELIALRRSVNHYEQVIDLGVLRSVYSFNYLTELHAERVFSAIEEEGFECNGLVRLGGRPFYFWALKGHDRPLYFSALKRKNAVYYGEYCSF